MAQNLFTLRFIAPHKYKIKPLALPLKLLLCPITNIKKNALQQNFVIKHLIYLMTDITRPF